jgi:hypothetical protein
VSDGAILGPRALNRALLARQGLLDRVDWSVTEAVDRLVGLQAQVPHAPFVALWSRLAHFDPAEVDALLEARRLVRAGVMRGTIHLLSPADCVGARQALEPLYAQVFRTAFGAGLRGADPHAVRAAGEALLTGTPMSRTELSAALAPSWPQAEPASLGQAVVHHAHVVQVPPRGLWRRPGPPVWARTADWVGEGQLPEPARVDDLVLRYLAAFGPATAADVRTWSRITGLRPVIEALRPRLRTFRDAAGRELLDVPDGLLPPPETPAPPRFLPEFDNITLSHDDRARILDGRGRARRCRAARGPARCSSTASPARTGASRSAGASRRSRSTGSAAGRATRAGRRTPSATRPWRSPASSPRTRRATRSASTGDEAPRPVSRDLPSGAS